MAESATILIPDNELLDAILAPNTGEFVLSEVEGDALLLYRKGKPIEAGALVRLCLSMFESFHTRLDRPGITERIGLRHVCIFHGLTVEWISVKNEIGDDEITYVEDGKILEKDLPARVSFVLKRLGPRRTFLEFHAKWLSSPEPPREMTNAILADYKRGLEAIKMLCEKG